MSTIPRAMLAAEKIEQTLREMAPHADIHFERVAVTPTQIREWSLPMWPTKASDTRAKSFGDVSLDAIPPDRLRGLVEDVIERHLPRRQFDILKAAEESERELLAGLVETAIRDLPR